MRDGLFSTRTVLQKSDHRTEHPFFEFRLPADTSTALVPATQDREFIRQRPELVARLRIEDRLTESQIVERLAQRTPPILVNRSTVCRDLAVMGRENRRLFDPRRFAALNFVLERVAFYEGLARKCVRDAHHSRDTRTRIVVNGFGSSPSCTTIWATSTMRRAGSNRSTIRSDRKCYLCARNELLPMCPERTLRN